MFRSRSWFGVGWSKPKNRLSLEHLKYLHNILDRNPTVSESNRGLLVESLRCIAEILIWGDQNDSSVFDFFLEKNMLSYFLHIMRQKSGGSSFVCVQLLQTLNILFENIRNETSLYYLLSNNHVNSIIVHKFDFSDEDVMGYYILFLKTLSLKLNPHTIHFFYNEHTNDFPLYTEAIKFFNHPESMVRIAVRTISLNVYKVENSSMLQFIRDKTAAPYFSNLVWFIGKHILELDACVRNDSDHQSQSRLSNLVAEHLDHLHYLNDILCLDIPDLNAVLTEHLLHKLFVPLYIFSLTPAPPLSMALVTQNLAAVLNKHVEIDIQELNNPRVSSVVALFLLSLVFLVITHAPLVHALAWVILNADNTVFKEGAAEVLNAYIVKREAVALGFGQPLESLEEALEISAAASSSSYSSATASEAGGLSRVSSCEEEHVNITDEEKQKLKRHSFVGGCGPSDSNRPFLDMVLSSMDCVENDYLALLALCLVYALANNRGVNADWLDQILNKHSPNSSVYKSILIDKLLQIINMSSQPTGRIRLVTLELSIKLFCQLIQIESAECCLLDAHHNAAFSARNQAMTVLRVFYKSEDIFLDLFEDEYNEMAKSTLNVEFLCMDSAVLLPPTGTPLTGIGFTRRLPCGEVEKARRAIRAFFLLRKLCQTVTYERETLLPLTNQSGCVQVDNVLDLNNSDLIACTVVLKDGTKSRRFLVIDMLQLILVEPVVNRLGWGSVKLVGFLQDVEVVGDKDDSRCLHITVHRGGVSSTNRTPILSAKFVFADHIRCMAAKQRLTKGRSKARQKKMYQIAQMLEIPGQLTDPSAAASASAMFGSMSSATSSSLRSSPGHAMSNSGAMPRVPREHRPLFSTAARAPGVAAALRRDSTPSAGVSRMQMMSNRSSVETEASSRSKVQTTAASYLRDSSGDRVGPVNKSRDSSKNRSRDSSPRMPRPRSEEIPMEDFRSNSRTSSPSSRPSTSNAASRAHTPSRLAVVVEPLSIAVAATASPQAKPTTVASPSSVSTTPRTSLSSSGSANSPSVSSGTSSATVTLDSPTNDESSGVVTSKETSFIREKRKGVVETV